MQHIPRRHRAQASNLLNTAFPCPPLLRQQIHHRLRPVSPIPQQSQIAERFLRTAQFALPLTQLIAKRDEQLPKSHPLILRQRENTSNVIPLRGLFLLAKIPHQMAPMLVARGHAVEEKRIHVIIERLMIQEQFGKKAKIPTPPPLSPAINLEETNIIIPIDFIAGGMQKRAFGAVAGKLLQAIVVAEAKLADVDHVGFGEGLWVRGEVPGFHFVLAHLHTLEVAHARDFRLVLRHAAARAEFFDLFLARVGALGGGGAGGFGGGGGILQVGDVNVFAVVVGFGRSGGDDFGGDDGNGLIAAGAVVLFAADERGAGWLMGLGVAGCGGELWGF